MSSARTWFSRSSGRARSRATSNRIERPLANGERAVRAGTGRLFPQLPVRRPVPSLNFDEVGEAAPPSPTSHQAVRHAAQLLIMVLDKILSAIESNC